MEQARSNWAHNEAEPLQLPEMFSRSSAQPLNSPTFDDFMPLSNTFSPLPPPTMGNRFPNGAPNPPPMRPYDSHPSTISFEKSNDIWPPASVTNSPHNVPHNEPYPPANMPTSRASQNVRMSDQWAVSPSESSRLDARLPDRSFSNATQMKSFESSSMARTSSKPSEPWLSSNPMNRTTNSTATSRTASDIRTLQSSSKTSGPVTNRCSTRCKLGLLGFTIGFLAVGIAVAVVLVLWLRRQ